MFLSLFFYILEHFLKPNTIITNVLEQGTCEKRKPMAGGKLYCTGKKIWLYWGRDEDDKKTNRQCQLLWTELSAKKKENNHWESRYYELANNPSEYSFLWELISAREGNWSNITRNYLFFRKRRPNDPIRYLDIINWREGICKDTVSLISLWLRMLKVFILERLLLYFKNLDW